MATLVFQCDMPDELNAELQLAARECRMSPSAFAAQALECFLASRRLPAVSSADSAPRMLGHVPQKRTDERDEEPALEPAEIPSAEDLDGLADIA